MKTNSYVTLDLGGILTDPLGLGLAFFPKDGIAALGSSGGVLDHIPEGDISAEVFFQSTFTNQGQRKESKGKGEETEGRHG